MFWGPKCGSKKGVLNGGPERGFQMGVQNGGPKWGFKISDAMQVKIEE
jgi:hypothetical protein